MVAIAHFLACCWLAAYKRVVMNLLIEVRLSRTVNPYRFILGSISVYSLLTMSIDIWHWEWVKYQALNFKILEEIVFVGSCSLLGTY